MVQFRKGKSEQPKQREPIQGSSPTARSAALNLPWKKYLPWLIGMLAIIFVSFFPVLKADFIETWDDNAFILDNEVIRDLNAANLKSMFTEPVSSNYIPLVQLTWALEYKFFGFDPMPYHLNNLLLHLLAVILVFYILSLMRLKPLYALAGALLFGIHPMRVESVAWVTERKDLLYAVFFLASVIFYILYLLKEKRKRFNFIMSVIMMALSLLSKIQAVSLPLVFLLLDYYYGRPLKFRLLLEKIPFFVLSLFFGIMGILFLGEAGALEMNQNFTFTERLFFGLYSLIHYMVKFIFPFHLSASYPYPIKSGDTLPVIYYLSPLILLGTAWLVYMTRKTGRAVITGSLIFLVTIMFLLQIYAAGLGFRVDRYTYIPYLGIFFMLAWFAQYLAEKKKENKAIVLSVLGLFCLVCIYGTYERSKVWKNSITLWTDVISRYPDQISMAYYQRGVYYMNHENPDQALSDFNNSLRIYPKDYQSMINRGQVHFLKQSYDKALSDWRNAQKIKPGDAVAINNIASAYKELKMYDTAVTYFTKALSIDPEMENSIYHRGVTYQLMGNYQKSNEDLTRFVKMKSTDNVAFFRIGDNYRWMKQYRESIPWYNKALELKPDFGPAYHALSYVYFNLGDIENARVNAMKARQYGAEIPESYLKAVGM